MGGFLTSSIGKKVIMSVTGLFLILFLLVHLSINLLLLVGQDTFNNAAHFMQTNPLMKVTEMVLAIGFAFHIIYSVILTIQNMMSRPVKYAVVNRSESSTWASQNMLVLGIFVGFFLVIHLMNYYIKIHFDPANTLDDYTLVITSFSKWYFTAAYILWFISLYLHLDHAFQSAFHTLGLNNSNWMPRLKFISRLYAIVVSAGFSIIALYFFISQIS